MIRRIAIFLVEVSALLLFGCGAARAGTLHVDICGPNARDAGSLFPGDTGDGLSSTADQRFSPLVECPTGTFATGLELTFDGTSAPYNRSSGFKVTAPSGITINSIHVISAGSFAVGDGSGWWGEFYWNGGPGPAGRSGAITDSFQYYGCCSQTKLNSQSVGWFIACGSRSCSGYADVAVGELQLTADEKRAPDILPAGTDNLWYQSGWVRGTWPAGIHASDPSGVCRAFVSFGSLPAPFSGTPEFPNPHTWKQCADQNVSAHVDTSTSVGSQGLGVGTMKLGLAATNSAGVTASPAKTVYVDNQAPTVSLSGPTDASTAAGTQYITATAAAGPSGVSGISCSLDGSPYQWHPGSATQIPVAGIGTHVLSCSSFNNARSHDGSVAPSTPVGWMLRIRQPSSLLISFAKLVDGLRCAPVHELVPGAEHWVTVKRQGKLVLVRKRTRAKVKRVVRCHPRTIRRRVTTLVIVRRGRRLVKVKRVKTVQVAVAPHRVNLAVRRLPFGQRTTVSGWLGSPDGTALPGHQIVVLTAPDNGENHFALTAASITAADGSWSAVLPPGPSRLVEAAYGGGATSEPTFSAPVRLVVPAKVQIRVRPTEVPWGSKILISGRVLGGYIPPQSNVLKLLFGDGPKPHTIGTPEVRPDGRFSIPIAWSSGRGVVRYWFAVATLSEADYPYAKGTSRRVAVTVGLPSRGP